MRLFYADDLLGPWKQHPQSPIVIENGDIARPAGRVVELDDGRIFRYAQYSQPINSTLVRAANITELTTTSYKEEVLENPIVNESGSGWNSDGMHYFDPHEITDNKWIASVNGWTPVWEFGFEY